MASWTTKLYTYIPDYKYYSEIQTAFDAYVTANGKMWGCFWELYRLNSDGTLNFLDDADSGVNAMGWTQAKEDYLKTKCDNLLVTMASRFDLGTGLYADALLADTNKRATAISTMVTWIVDHGFAGASVNIEPITSIEGTKKTQFISLMTDLATALHNEGKILAWAGHMRWDPNTTGMHAGTDYTGEDENSYLKFTLDELEASGVDICEAQCYDQFYDFSAIHGIVTDDQIQDTIDFFQGRLPNSKISMIIPAYGVRTGTGESYAQTGGGSYNNMSEAQLLAVDANIYTGASRDSSSQLLRNTIGGHQFLFADETSVNHHRQLVEDEGVEYVGIWLGGDYPMPSGKSEPSLGNEKPRGANWSHAIPTRRPYVKKAKFVVN